MNNRISENTERNLREAIAMAERASERSLRISRRTKPIEPHVPSCGCRICRVERG